jgi:outer membrane protein
MKKIAFMVIGFLSTPSLFASTDLLAAYQQAAKNNGTYQAAVATYKAAGYNVPIARAALLPSAVIGANIGANQQNPAAPGTPANFNSSGYSLTLTQPLLNIGAWYAYSEVEATYKQAAATFAAAQQNLIMTTATAYFGVLEAQEQLKYAQANEDSLAEQLRQVEAQYKVGLKAQTDVQATRASYESAVASTIAAQNSLNNAMENLTAVTGQNDGDLTPLKQDFPLVKPDPQNAETWVNYGLKNNVNLQFQQFQAEITHTQIKTDFTNYFIPTINAVGYYSNFNNPISTSQTGAVAGTYTNGSVATTTGELALNYNVFNGFGNQATVKQDKYTYQAAQANVLQTQRVTAANVRQAYLNVISDISQVQALQQAVISGQVSLKAIRSGYLVGVRTIVDVLTEQSNLYNSQQQYTQAIYQYITDSLNLKEQAGSLNPQDIAAVNTWLETMPTAQVVTPNAVAAKSVDVPK